MAGTRRIGPKHPYPGSEPDKRQKQSDRDKLALSIKKNQADHDKRIAKLAPMYADDFITKVLFNAPEEDRSIIFREVCKTCKTQGVYMGFTVCQACMKHPEAWE